uniref:growth arrest and DNA damage-inducible protein GADD45 gamma-like n=1 Tax=Myxine glutinosa TaxID=7769 RepID=UPI00358E6C15
MSCTVQHSRVFNANDRPLVAPDYQVAMTLEDFVGNDVGTGQKLAGQALEELLLEAQKQGAATLGVYEAAKLLNVDPDSVLLCVLAADEEDEADLALQIHFTLIQAFCCENEIAVLRLGGVQRLAELLGDTNAPDEPRDLHCVLLSGGRGATHLLQPPLHRLTAFCAESRGRDQWVPFISLPQR